MSGSADKDERAALIRRLREGQCADNMGCGTMKMCVCANATDAADYLEKLAAVPECGRRFDLAASLKELRDRWASIVESQNWGDQFDGDFTTLDELHAHLTGAENCPDGEAVSGCGTTNGPGGRAPASGSGGDDAGPTPAAPPTNPSASAGSTPAGSASLSAIGTLLKVDERDPNHRECQRQDAALVHRILRLQEEVAKQHRAACDATGEAIHWKKVAQGNSPFTEVRSTSGTPSDIAKLEAMTKATYSHVDGRDLLHELQPNGAHHIDIKVRINGQDRWYEGDWLKLLTWARDGHRMAEYADNPKLRAYIENAKANSTETAAQDTQSGTLSATGERK